MRARWISFSALAAGLALAACSDLSNDPAAPPADSPAFAAGGQGKGKSALDLVEEDYSAGLLDKNNANRYRQYAVSAPGKLPPKYRSTVKAKDATYSMVLMAREWDKLSSATKQEILDIRRNGRGNLGDSVTTAHYVLHYTRQGNNAVPALDADRNRIPDYIDAAARSWEEVWNREVVQLGYPAPVGTPRLKFHVYYRDFAVYGVTYPENVQIQATSPVPLGTASGYIEVENDFAGFPPNDVDVTGTETLRFGALRVTQAHEFMHACQFNINVFQSGWLFESHATWAEDAVYDGINDWHWYVPFFLSTPDLPIFSRYVYGSAYFMNYLSETFGVDVTRRIWLAARTRSTPDAIRTAAFGGSWEAMKLFAPAEYGLGISDFTTDGPSVVPAPTNRIRATHTSYPVAVSVDASTKKVANRAPSGLGANFIEFVPGGARGTLTLSFDGADGVAWRAFVSLAPASGTASPTVLPVALNAAGAGSIDISGFGTRWAKATLMPTIADTAGVEVPFSYAATIE